MLEIAVADGQLNYLYIMVSPKKFIFVVLTLLTILWIAVPQAVYAARSDYFDFGPYYGQPQVLGFSFSSLENLPAPKLADNLMPKKAIGILPDSPFYPLERTVEFVQLTFTFDPVKKEELRLDIASERLVEAKTMLDAGKTEVAAKSLDYYKQILQDVTSNIANADRVEEVTSSQAVITQSLALTSTPVQAEEWNLAAKAIRETLDKAVEVKGGPAIPEDLSADIQKLKEQGLVSEEESNKLYSLKNRGEVREELDKLASSGQFPASELIKLDTAVAKNYPDVQKEMTANFQVAELRAYQTLPQPSEKVLDEITKWQGNPSVPPPNDIKPYLWHSRAQDLAKEVDLSNFSPDQQQEVGKLYPKAITDNPTYVPLPSPSPSPSPAPAADTNQTPSPTPVSTPTPAPVNPYLGGTDGTLPGQPTYFIKRWGENLQTVFTFDPAEKARLKLQQAERRLNEAADISSDPKKEVEYEDAVKSYSQAMADASSYLKSSKNEDKARDVADELEVAAARHEAMLEKGLLPAPKDPKLISEAIKATEDALDRSADVQGRPALPPLLADRLGDLKAQGLVLPEEADDLVRSSSREEAREKIRKLIELGSFPLADAKKMDEAQMLTSSSDYNQLVEVKKVEELQNLRAVQSEFAQTPTLKAAAQTLGQKEVVLINSIDLSGIKQEDLAGRQDLVQTYQQLVATASARPINSGQFIGLPEEKINDYDQYKCEGYGKYYSFAARKCVAYEPGEGFKDDARPICPVNYNWSWETQSCQAMSRGNLYPTPSPEPEPKDEKEQQERSESCPEGSSYKSSRGCVWEKDDKLVYDSGQYRCGARQYYSFAKGECVSSPKEGDPYPKDAAPTCKEADSFWSWSEGKCVKTEEPKSAQIKDVAIPKPFFVTPDSPFYFLKKVGETVQLALSLTPEARQQTRASQARERLAEGYAALEKGDKEDFSKALTAYTVKMQDIYNDISKSSLSEKAKKSIAENLTKEAVEQNLILQKLEVVATDEQASVLSAASSSVILGVDKAADLAGEPSVPDTLKAKVSDLPAEMISEEDKKKLLEANSRVEARLELGELAARGGLTAADTAFLNEDFDAVDPGAKLKINALNQLEEIVNTLDQKEKALGKVEKNENIVGKLAEFQKSFEPGKDIPAEIRPYVRLSRIDEVAQTIRPDIVRLGDFQNRKDVILAVATLQEEFRPTQQAVARVETFRRNNPGASLPPELARIEALAFSLGTRNQAGPCYLPTPPFPPNTPCPPPGAPIPVASYAVGPGYAATSTSYSWQESVDKDGKPLVYGQGPATVNTGVCPNGYHWMYDSGGWCMSNSGNYSSSYAGYTPSGPQTPGYTPYSSYYTAPGAPPAGGYYPGGNFYSPPSYYGSAPTYYTTNPPVGTVPGSGPAPTSYGQCPSGFHWMSDNGGWCMADGGTYVPSSGYTGYPAPGGYSPNLTQSSCGPGYYWDGRGCIATYSPSGSGSYYSGWSGSSCTPPSNGCGPNSWWDYGSCSCRASYSANQCQSLSCGGGSYPDYSTCSCRYPSSGTYGGSTYTPPSSSCIQPSTPCPNNSWFDFATCTCRQSGGSGSSTYTPPPPSSSCIQPSTPCPDNSWFDSGTCTCRQSGTGGSSPSTPPPSGGSCPSGYHWVTDNGGWCMQDGAGSTPPPPSTSTPPPPPPPPPSEPAPPPPPSSSCIQPSTPCPDNSWFDSGTCTCRSS